MGREGRKTVACSTLRHTGRNISTFVKRRTFANESLRVCGRCNVCTVGWDMCNVPTGTWERMLFVPSSPMLSVKWRTSKPCEFQWCIYTNTHNLCAQLHTCRSSQQPRMGLKLTLSAFGIRTHYQKHIFSYRCNRCDIYHMYLLLSSTVSFRATASCATASFTGCLTGWWHVVCRLVSMPPVPTRRALRAPASSRLRPTALCVVSYMCA